MAQLTEKDTVRVTVHARDVTVDLSLSNRVPISRLAPLVAEQVAGVLDERDMDAQWLVHPTSEILLAPPTGANWEPTDTLNSVGVTDGDSVVLTVEDASERYLPLIEVMQDATAKIRNERFQEWDTSTSFAFATRAFPAALAALAVATDVVGLSHPDSFARWVGAVVMGLVAALCVGLSFTPVTDEDSAIIKSLSVAGYAPAAAAVVLLVPGPLHIWHILAAGVVVSVLASISITLQRPPLPAHYAALVPGVSFTIAAALGLAIGAWRDVDPSTVAAIAATVAVVVFRFEPNLSRRGARLEPTYLPAETDEGEDITVASIADRSRALSNDAGWGSMVDQVARNEMARSNALGIVLGTIISLTISAAAAAWLVVSGRDVQYVISAAMFDQRSVMMFHIAVISAIFAFRGSWYRDRALRGLALVGGLVSWLTYVVVYAAFGQDTSPVRATVAVVASLVVVGVSATVAWRRGQVRSARARAWAERFEALLFMFPVVNIVTLINLFFLVQHR